MASSHSQLFTHHTVVMPHEELQSPVEIKQEEKIPDKAEQLDNYLTQYEALLIDISRAAPRVVFSYRESHKQALNIYEKILELDLAPEEIKALSVAQWEESKSSAIGQRMVYAIHTLAQFMEEMDSGLHMIEFSSYYSSDLYKKAFNLLKSTADQGVAVAILKMTLCNYHWVDNIFSINISYAEMYAKKYGITQLPEGELFFSDPIRNIRNNNNNKEASEWFRFIISLVKCKKKPRFPDTDSRPRLSDTDSREVQDDCISRLFLLYERSQNASTATQDAIVLNLMISLLLCENKIYVHSSYYNSFFTFTHLIQQFNHLVEMRPAVVAHFLGELNLEDLGQAMRNPNFQQEVLSYLVPENRDLLQRYLQQTEAKSDFTAEMISNAPVLIPDVVRLIENYLDPKKNILEMAQAQQEQQDIDNAHLKTALAEARQDNNLTVLESALQTVISSLHAEAESEKSKEIKVETKAEATKKPKSLRLLEKARGLKNALNRLEKQPKYSYEMLKDACLEKDSSFSLYTLLVTSTGDNSAIKFFRKTMGPSESSSFNTIYDTINSIDNRGRSSTFHKKS